MRLALSLDSRRRRIRLVMFVISLVAIAAICSGTAIGAVSSSKAGSSKPHRTSLAGIWSGRYGGAYSGTFTIHWTQTGSILRGSITLSNPSGKYSIGGSVHGTAINFGAVGVGATYTGSVSGKSMSGKYKSATGGGSWSAHKTS